MSHSKCRPKYWSQIKENENQAGVKFHKWSELKNQIDEMSDIELPEDIIFNFVNNDSLFNDNYIEDPEDTFEVTQFFE